MTDAGSDSPPPVDIEAHAREAEAAYQRVRPLYEAFSEIVRSILGKALESKEVKVASIEARAKTVLSFAAKASALQETDPSQPKYREPLREITDLAGVRVITFFPRTVRQVCAVVEDEFDVRERIDKTATLHKEDRFGYQSIHYIAGLKHTRTGLPEYGRFAGLVGEIQVRTILQHAWAEIEHDIQYKSVETIPAGLQRRFMSLAGMLEIADREFQAIQDEDEEFTRRARQSVAEGKLESVEITPDALKSYLNKRLGSDLRMSDWSYQYTARLLKRLGFTDLKQVEECIDAYDDDRLSRQVYGNRQGQLTRFELMVQVGMGEAFFDRHHLNGEHWWQKHREDRLARLRERGVSIGTYVPAAPTSAPAKQAGS